MHVFIDTNVLLNFYHFSSDDLDSLGTVFGTHKHGSATVYLTAQLQDEFHRNREIKIKDAVKRFKDSTSKYQIPTFMRGYEECNDIQRLASDLTDKTATLLKRVLADVENSELLADSLIETIFQQTEILPTTDAVYDIALKRSHLGNPPGKKNSIGDAVNWIQLLSAVPHGERLHIISEDGDFFSLLNEDSPHPFLTKEWQSKKSAELKVYRTIAAFLKDNFDGVAFSFDKDKERLISGLESSGSFATTHQLIGQLEKYSYFSHKEVERILTAAEFNSQFGYIVTDSDVSDFLNRVAVPRYSSLTSESQKTLLREVIEEQKRRATNDIL